MKLWDTLMRLTIMNDSRFEALQSAPLDSWIALSEDEPKIVAVGGSYDEVVTKSENAGVSDPVLIKTPLSLGFQFQCEPKHSIQEVSCPYCSGRILLCRLDPSKYRSAGKECPSFQAI